MDCNRDEALRAKEIAEMKFYENDFVGAKKFILKAQNLCPALEGIKQMITSLDVYIAGEQRINGMKDWYAILCINASVDEETLKKQYRKLALQLHPDKNKSFGAEGAFKLVSEAWSVLSDKEKKFIYDQKRDANEFMQRVPNSQNVPPFTATANTGFNIHTGFNIPTESQSENFVGKKKVNEFVQRVANSLKESSFTATASSGFKIPTKPQTEQPFHSAASYGFEIPTNSQTKQPVHSAASYGFNFPTKAQTEQPGHSAATYGFNIPTKAQTEQPGHFAASYGFNIPTKSQTEHPVHSAASCGFKIPTASQKEPQVPTSAADGIKIPTKAPKQAPVPSPGTTATAAATAPTSAAAASGLKKPKNKTTSGAEVRRRRTATKRGAPSAALPSSQLKVDTFWTSCPSCKLLYEYQRTYLNHNLVCATCNKAFTATETAGPTDGINQMPPRPASKNQQHAMHDNKPESDTCGPAKNDDNLTGIGAKEGQHETQSGIQHNENYNWSTFFKQASGASANAPSAAAQPANVFEQMRRGLDKIETDERKEEALDKKVDQTQKRTHSSSENVNVGVGGNLHHQDRMGKKRRNVTDDLATNVRRASTKQAVQGIGKGGNSSSRFKMAYNAKKRSSKSEIKGVLMEKGKFGIKGKLAEWKVTGKEGKGKKKQKPEDTSAKLEEKDKGKPSVAADSGNFTEANKDDGLKNLFNEVPDGEPSNNHDSDSDYVETEKVLMDVPDPDFYNFDGDRSENSFGDEDIWAVYDNEDGMPRFYALVQKVVSVKPFKIHISFLIPKSCYEFGPLNWLGLGFAKTCGTFKIGKYEINDTLNIFSHKVRWEKGLREAIKIVPRRGDVWALYKNWSPNWNKDTAKEVIYKYEMVEVLDDYNEHQGIYVMPLLKVAGFKNVFHRHLDYRKVRRIAKKDMFRFSHQVPAYVLTGKEAGNAPKGCLELDPASTPMELLQVITVAKKDEVLKADDLAKRS
ncbi:DnaJ domain-containing protein [Dioscorea alata]|uniref:DnaJ domain-containing protein n=1 Tax=Dioscorea alata TaxID=55571 RepID=A0ACB7V9C7_DIOAL|nr:DnaJ domain-containing protein [Dioscorea alata]